MGIKMKIPWFLQRDTNGMKEVEVNGNTVGDCLRNLVGLFPHIERELFDQQAKLSPFVDIHIGGRSVYSEGLARVVKDGDELSILLVVDGG